MSTLQDADLFLVERAGVSYKLAAANFNDKLQDNDVLLVERAGVSYKMPWSDNSKLQNTDLLLVERAGVSYKVTWQDTQNLIGGDIQASLYNGSSGSIPIVTGFKPGLIWIKCRTNGGGFPNCVYDRVRGVNTYIRTDARNGTDNRPDSMPSFNNDGFTVGPDPNASCINRPNETFVAWTWGTGDGYTNTDGNINSTVYANDSGTFSVVGYQGTGAIQTVGHGLKKPPAVIWWKRYSSGGDNWVCYFEALGPNQALVLDETQSASQAAQFSAAFNNTAPNDTTFTIGNQYDATNKPGESYVAYCWAPAGNQAFGSYNGNGSTNGPKITTGFPPGILIIKNTSSQTDWNIFDTARSPTNPATKFLTPNDSRSELDDPSNAIDFLSDGFQLKGTKQDTNAAANYVYMAFQRSD